ncbi:hypothetical protein [Rhodoferax koreensis]|nr:hypothetical protein [Rhodoferax koreense]
MIAQFCIGLFGLTALAMTMFGNERARRWSPIVGMCGQPFWIYFSVTSSAWGVLVLSAAYALVYGSAIWVHWGWKR